MNPPHNITEDGEVVFLPVPTALPGDDLCSDCRQQSDEWSKAAKRHREENHQVPWQHDCLVCSLDAYSEEREAAWQAHLVRCKECKDVSDDSYVREAHRDFC